MEHELKDYPISEEEIIADIKDVARKTGTKGLTLNEYSKHGKYRYYSIRIRFETWHNAMKKAGMEPVRPLMNHYVIDEESLIKNLDDVWRKLGKQPTLN